MADWESARIHAIELISSPIRSAKFTGYHIRRHFDGLLNALRRPPPRPIEEIQAECPHKDAYGSLVWGDRCALCFMIIETPKND